MQNNLAIELGDGLASLWPFLLKSSSTYEAIGVFEQKISTRICSN